MEVGDGNSAPAGKGGEPGPPDHAATSLSSGTPSARIRDLAGTDVILEITALAIAVGIIHLAVIAENFEKHWFFGVFFMVVGLGQFTWGACIYVRPSRELLFWGGVVGSLVLVSIWAFTRIIGTVIGPEGGSPETVGILDVVAVIDELVIAGLTLLLLRNRGEVRFGRHPRLTYYSRELLAYGLTFLSLVALFIGIHPH